MKLKMRNISNLDTFFKVINQCDGAVELSLPEGGSVNLKSKLSQYFSMATVFSNGSIKELSLRCVHGGYRSATSRPDSG